jgi:hypothetical protein
MNWKNESTKGGGSYCIELMEGETEISIDVYQQQYYNNKSFNTNNWWSFNIYVRNKTGSIEKCERYKDKFYGENFAAIQPIVEKVLPELLQDTMKLWEKQAGEAECTAKKRREEADSLSKLGKMFLARNF